RAVHLFGRGRRLELSPCRAADDLHVVGELVVHPAEDLRQRREVLRDHLAGARLVDEQEAWMTTESRLAAETHHGQEKGQLDPQAFALVLDPCEAHPLAVL